MEPKEVGRRLSVNGGRFGMDLQFNVASAIRIPGMGDRDRDGVPDMYDCQPLNPNADGFWGDVGRAVKERTSSEIEDIKERTVRSIKGEDVYGGRTITKRAILRGVEQEEELKESIQQARKRGKRKAQRRYGVPTTTPTKTKKKTAITYDRDIEDRGTVFIEEPVKKKITTNSKTHKKTKSKYPSCV